jgi:hypothetical protein
MNKKGLKPFGVQESRLKLPVKADHIEAVLEYLYADEVRSLATSEDTEFISHVLVVADQFLLIRLKVPLYLHHYSMFWIRVCTDSFHFYFFWLPDSG